MVNLMELEKVRNKRNIVNVNEFEILANELINTINKLDLSSHTKGHLYTLLQKFYRDVVLNEIIKISQKEKEDGRNED